MAPGKRRPEPPFSTRRQTHLQVQGGPGAPAAQSPAGAPGRPAQRGLLRGGPRFPRRQLPGAHFPHHLAAGHVQPGRPRWQPERTPELPGLGPPRGWGYRALPGSGRYRSPAVVTALASPTPSGSSRRPAFPRQRGLPCGPLDYDPEHSAPRGGVRVQVRVPGGAQMHQRVPWLLATAPTPAPEISAV